MAIPYKLKACKYCGAVNSHLEFACYNKPKKQLKSSSKLQAKKPMNKHGKHYKKWQQTRNKWLEQNKAPYYFCYLCGKLLTRSQLTLDHVKSRSRYPELRYKLSNLQACCWNCNTLKGSRDIDQL